MVQVMLTLLAYLSTVEYHIVQKITNKFMTGNAGSS